MAKSPASSGVRKSPGLIVTRTPLRVSFAGGGTDLAEFYGRDYGAVLSTTIDKYLYVTVKRHGDLFGEPIRISYSHTELVDSINEIKNNIARECLKFLKVEPPIYISTVSDLPGFSGLGSSSAFAVGLLHALHAMKGELVSGGQLAQEASRIEIDIIKEPIGKQDQYIAAIGGFNYIRFMGDGRVNIEPQHFPNGEVGRLFDHLLMFWTGMGRDASTVLVEQKKNTRSRLAELNAMRGHAEELRSIIHRGFDAKRFGSVLHDSWTLKRRLASGITNNRIENWYKRALKAGAYGGKLCGAGGGGFLLFVAPPAKHTAVRKALKDLSETEIGYESRGSRLMLPFVG